MRYLFLFIFSFQAHAAFNWNDGLVPTYKADVISNLEVSAIKLQKVEDEFPSITELKVIEVKYFKNLPAPILEDQNGNRYTALFGDWVHTDYVATKILSYMGAQLNPKKIFENVRINFNDYNMIDFFQFWNESPVVLKREDSFSHNSSGWTIKKVLLQKIGGNKFSLKKNFLPLSFIQNGEPEIQDFRYSLGHSLTHSTPNMYRPYLFNQNKYDQLDFVIRNQEMKKIAKGLSKNDFENFASKLLALDFNTIRSFFIEAKYPKTLTELYIRKMQERVADFLLRANKIYPVEKSSYEYTHMPYIKNGEVLKDYPSFKVDLTETVIENLMATVGSKVWGMTKDILAQIISATPYVGKDFKIFGNNIGIGPSVTLRFERKISENDNADSVDDLYIVTDVITVGIVVGLGLEGRTILGNGWARVGPGYHRYLSYQRKTSSYQDALDLPWVQSFTKTLKPDLEKVKAGESLGVKNSVMLGLLAGGNHKIGGFGLARVGGYLMAGGYYSWATQVNRSESGRWTLLTGKEKTASASTKIYLRALNRFFRLPILQASISTGGSDIDAFYIDAEQYNALNQLERISKDEAMYIALTTGLTKEVGSQFNSIKIEDDFDYKRIRYNFFRWKGHYMDLETSRTYTDKNSKKHFYISKEDRSHQVSNNAERCEVIGVIEYESKKELEMKDKGISIKCTLKLQGPDHELQNKSINKLTSTFNLKKDQFKIPYKTEGLTDPKYVIGIHSYINSKDLDSLLNIGNESSDPIHDKILNTIKTLNPSLKNATLIFFKILISQKSIQDKLDFIVHYIRVNGSSNYIRPVVLSLISPSTKVEFKRQGQLSKSKDFGSPIEFGSAFNYINNLDEILGAIHIRDF